MLKEHKGQHFNNKFISYGEGCLALLQTPKLEDHPLSAFRVCWFSVFAAILHTQPEADLVTRDPPNMAFK
jgi:hypothetical protein